MVKKILIALFLFASAAYGDGPRLSANPYDPNSTSNPVGIYGSPNSPVSVNNPYGQGLPLAAPRAEPQGAAPVINVWTAPAPAAPTWDGAGLDTLGAPGSGLQFKTDKPAAPVVAAEAATAAPEVLPESGQNNPGYVDAYEVLQKIRREAKAAGK